MWGGGVSFKQFEAQMKKRIRLEETRRESKASEFSTCNDGLLRVLLPTAAVYELCYLHVGPWLWRKQVDSVAVLEGSTA